MRTPKGYCTSILNRSCIDSISVETCIYVALADFLYVYLLSFVCCHLKLKCMNVGHHCCRRRNIHHLLDAIVPQPSIFDFLFSSTFDIKSWSQQQGQNGFALSSRCDNDLVSFTWIYSLIDSIILGTVRNWSKLKMLRNRFDWRYNVRVSLFFSH